MTGWYEAKQFVEQATTLSMDALHVMAGVLLLLGFSLILRRPVSDIRPWLAVLAAELLNEAADIWAGQWPSAGMQLGEAAKDIVMTMVLPTVILLTARALPQIYKPRRRR